MGSHPLQQTALGVIVATPILAAIFVALRIYTRKKLSLKLGLDDWCIVAASILSIALIAPSWEHVVMWHIGWHVWEIPLRDLEPNYDAYYAVLLSFQLINIPILPLAKVSILILLLRGGGVIPWLRKIIYAILFFTIASSLIPWFIYIFICRPLTGNTWDPNTFGKIGCIGRYRMGEMVTWVTCANLVTDVLVLPIPFIIVRRLMSTRLRSKLVVLVTFLCGLCVTGISGAKIYLQYRERIYGLGKPDWTYDINYCITHVENNVAIILANIPVLRGLVTRWFLDFRTQGQPVGRGLRASTNWMTNTSSDFSGPSQRSQFIQRAILCDKTRRFPTMVDSNENEFPQPTLAIYTTPIDSHTRSHMPPMQQCRNANNSILGYPYIRNNSNESDMEDRAGSLDSTPTYPGSDETVFKDSSK